LKVLFYESRPEWGGAQKCELDLIYGLTEFGVETIFVTSTDGPMLNRLSSFGKKINLIPIHSQIDSIRKDDMKGGIWSKVLLGIYMIPHFLKLMKFVSKNKVDIIYTSQFRSQILIGWIGKILRKKVIWHLHGEEQLNNLLGKWAMATSDQIIVVSKKLCEKYQNEFPKNKGKFRFIANGVEVPGRKISNPSKVIQLITVGALIEGKRQDLSIKACQQLIESGFSVHLHIVGEKPPWHSEHYKNELYDLVEHLNLANNVTFHGWVESPFELMAEADIFILPSDTEGLPLSIIEAMAIGIPTIATDVGGVSELIIHGKTGLLIDKDSLPELVLMIRKLIENQELREEMGKRAFQLYQNQYTKRAFLEGVYGVLRTI
jgi:L-malate glycosyltransferase